ncbi:hypothetical protein [Polaribacter porphyrae]|uniref:Cardiolipin synthase N-terminal domain-containing protein n=1 Tax=Polaribacter porphyrae TaxID=1137780 RepID=A0A2S7WPU4_9FLAO|nr:hypothetical protein [Polaribacter porphyrae]PQJ79301.1 hypothetical protein BTO18_09005 [Polaribacter porphyrae]
MYYYLIIAFQFYCIYHAYKNGKNYFWYFIIFFIPLLGCLVYLFTQVVNKRDVESISDEITTIINPTKKIKDLERVLEFSNTFQNTINLADAYKEINNFNTAIQYYEKALLSKNFKDDPHTINKLIFCYYQQKNYKKVIEYASKIDLDKEFNTTNFYYGLALEQENNNKEAEFYLRKIDKRFSNYEERIELADFLVRQDKKEEAKEILQEIIDEINSLTNKTRTHKSIFNIAKTKLNEV